MTDVPVDLTQTSATALLQLLQTRRIGALELLDQLLARHDDLNPHLNAVVGLERDSARAAARRADNTPADARGALHGLPMTCKDVWEVEGFTATCGLPELAQHRPQADADAVARLRRAGAIPFGKTNVPTLAADHQTYNPVYGVTNNPWDVSRTPGGSSGGAAAAIAAGLTPLELGSDIGGSIRCPSHFCGIYGHKSSYGIVPLRGHIPPFPGSNVAPPLGVAGPMARHPLDLELALDVLAGPAATDTQAWAFRLPEARHARLRDFRVAVWVDAVPYSTDSRYLEAIRSYALDLERVGVTVDWQARPAFNAADSDDLYVALLFRAISAGMPEAVLSETDAAAGLYTADPRQYPQRIARAMRLPYSAFVDLLEQQQRLCAQWRAFFTQVDLLLCPIMPNSAFAHDHSGQGAGHIAQYARSLQVDGRPVPYLHGLQWPGLATVANLPSTAIPTGRCIDGLPVGFQAIGPYLEDRTALRFAALTHAAFGAPPLPTLERIRTQSR